MQAMIEAHLRRSRNNIMPNAIQHGRAILQREKVVVVVLLQRAFIGKHLFGACER